jgi:hypothetical protein
MWTSLIKANFSRCVLLMTFLIFWAPGCDQRPPAGNDAPEAPPPPRYAAEISVVTPLAARRATHVAVDPAGNIFFVQESDDGNDVMFVAGANDVSRATALSSSNILSAAGAAPGETGNIQSIAAGPAGEIYFYFLGGGKRNTVACFGRFIPRNAAITILATNDQLQTASGMGRSIELARGTTVTAGKLVWLLLRHTDQAALFHVEPRRVRQDQEQILGDAITKLRTAEGELPLTRPDIDLAPGHPDDGSVLLSDLWSGAIWNVDATGNASVLCSLVGLSRSLSLPATTNTGPIVMFAAAGDAIIPHVPQRIDAVKIDGLSYPAVLMLQPGGNLTAIARDDIRGPAGLPLRAIAFQQLVYEPARSGPRSGESFIGFDAASGQILRLRIWTK